MPMAGTGIKCVGGLIMIFVLKWHSTLTTLLVFALESHKVSDTLTPCLMTNGQCCERAMTLLFVKLSHTNVIYWGIRWPETIRFTLHAGHTIVNESFDFAFYTIFLTSCSNITNGLERKRPKKTTHWLVSNHRQERETKYRRKKKQHTHTKCSLDIFVFRLPICCCLFTANLIYTHLFMNIYFFRQRQPTQMILMNSFFLPIVTLRHGYSMFCGAHCNIYDSWLLNIFSVVTATTLSYIEFWFFFLFFSKKNIYPEYIGEPFFCKHFW